MDQFTYLAASAWEQQTSRGPGSQRLTVLTLLNLSALAPACRCPGRTADPCAAAINLLSSVPINPVHLRPTADAKKDTYLEGKPHVAVRIALGSIHVHIEPVGAGNQDNFLFSSFLLQTYPIRDTCCSRDG